MDKAFCDRVTADHYVFCGNGQHENPDLEILQVIFDCRLANDKKPFKFWFNSSSNVSTNNDGRKHMEEVENLVTKLAAKSKNRLKNKFVQASAIRVI
jgi:hypothetical protein